MTVKYTQHIGNKSTPQTQAIPGREADMTTNSAGGVGFKLDEWDVLDRFLVLGTEGGTYYATEQKLTRDNAKAVEALIKNDGQRVVARVVEFSDSGRAPKNDPAILVLAMAAKLGDDGTRKSAYLALSKVCRIGTHLMHFAEYMEAFGGWGRGAKVAVGKWYTGRSVESLANQMVKYQSRDKWSHRDLLRLSHVKAPNDEYNVLFKWAGSQYSPEKAAEARTELDKAIYQDNPINVPSGLHMVWAFEQAKKQTDANEIVKLINHFKLPREAIPTEFLTKASVWEALLPHMGMTALIRNLANMTRAELVAPLSDATRSICQRLQSQEELNKARVHPIAVLTALKTYASGHGLKGSNTWTPVQQVCDALDAAFYLSFKSIVPANKRFVLALDVSGSMDMGEVAGVAGLSPRVASAALALVTAATEQETVMMAFSSSAGSRVHRGVSMVNITPKDRLDTACLKSSKLSAGMGTTDTSLPPLWAIDSKVKTDVFVILTDNETYQGEIHTSQAIAKYRNTSGIDAKLVVVGMTSTGFTIADPSDPGMLDVVGFDSATPSLISDFSR